MSTSAPARNAYDNVDEKTYVQRKRAWAMYDWANSAFATTILAAVLPVYYSSVAGASLPSEADATFYWSISLAVGLLLIAVLSPLLGTVSDVVRGKKTLLALFATLGILSTALLVFVGTGDWLLASGLFILGRVGFSGSIVFYDSLLPHVARPDEVDELSTTGYALGYLGGGLLLAINVVMIVALGGEFGARLSFLSVALWWAVFSLPVLRLVPEPPAATAVLRAGENVFSVSVQRLATTFRDLREYRELFKFLLAFLIYNDGIGTIIGIAAIYGAELGFGTIELLSALLLVQFVGIPFTMVFGRLPYPNAPRRAIFLAFIVWNVVMLPLVGTAAKQWLPADVVGAPLPDYQTVGRAVGTDAYAADQAGVVDYGQFSEEGQQIGVQPTADGLWESRIIAKAEFDGEPLTYLGTAAEDAAYSLTFNGQRLELFYSQGPDRGIFRVYLDGQPYTFEDSDDALGVGEVNGYRETVRWNNRLQIEAPQPGVHTLIVRNLGVRSVESDGTWMDLGRVEVLPPVRQSRLPAILTLLLLVEVLGMAVAWTFGASLVAGLAQALNTKRSVLLALLIYAVIAVWGFFLDAVIEFWLLAWLVAIVQGGSQALSRSLYASMSPRAKSGEFFGFFSVMEKFAGIIGPIIFAAVIAVAGSSRPAVLSLIALFVVGGGLLMLVDVDEGRRIARAEDSALAESGLIAGDEEP